MHEHTFEGLFFICFSIGTMNICKIIFSYS